MKFGLFRHINWDYIAFIVEIWYNINRLEICRILVKKRGFYDEKFLLNDALMQRKNILDA